MGYGPTNALAALSDGDREVVRRCLLAAARGDLFPEEEFHSLFGMTRAARGGAGVAGG